MRFKLPAVFLSLLFLFSCGNAKKETKNLPSVAKVMDEVVSRLYSEYEKTTLDTISHNFILNYLSETEKEALASQYWNLEVNVPVIVSLMRDKDQKVLPFWLENSGFELTDMVVKNTHSTYEVWQKDFDAGSINLGINGFGKHRPVYFLGIGPKNAEDSLGILPVFPESQHFETFEVGAFTYHDWDGLTLTEVPSSLKGQKLLTTIRGRAREAHLVDAFRTTQFPSSDKPDHLLLTWSADPSTTVDIQWRTSQNVSGGMVKYWKKGTQDTLEISADKFLMEDRLLQNDRYIHRFTAKLKSLAPEKSYEYLVGSHEGGWSEPQHFSTAPNTSSPFSFIWFGDVHNSEIWGQLAQESEKTHPENDFYFISGDLVNTGLHRDDWDKLFQYGGTTFSRKPLLAVPGNHDSQDGLGAWMYEEMLSLPKDSPTQEMEGRTYAFNYQNALFLMIDATFPLEDQTNWIKQKLSESNATWKIAVFHFPPYNAVEPYQDIQEEWVPLFDQYHVDMVMGGHFHYYMRSKPLKNGEVQPSPADGTLYLISIGTTGKNKEIEKEPYAAVQFPAEHQYQLVDIDGKTLKYSSINFKGETVDQFEIRK
ncbi:MAG: metallophosphoesterase family protein [Cyclobacteriaceae bacterium]